MAKKKVNIIAIIAIAVVVIAVIAVFSLSKTDEVISEEGIVSKIEGLVADDIACVYFGNTSKFGHFAQYSGKVFNEGNSSIEGAKIVVEFIDSEGKIVGTHETSLIGETVEPGMKRPFFSYTEKDTLSGEFESCRAVVQ